MTKTALYNAHEASKAKFVSFAGYELPILYQDSGIIKEHLAVRSNSGMFDVSHMGQAILTGEKVENFLSYITPTNFIDTDLGKAKYTVLLNEKGSVIDDLIFYKLENKKYLVIFNAARKDIDIKWLSEKSDQFNCQFTPLPNQHLIALQGPESAKILSKIIDLDLDSFPYMSVKALNFNNEQIFISRSGYTGEDGFEISSSEDNIQIFWKKLVELEVQPVGLGARDSLRMEMGFPLYGSDLSEEINIAESNLNWIISSNDNFIGKDQISTSPKTKRLALRLLDKGILRENMNIFLPDEKTQIGKTTSGCFSPSLNYSIGQCYIDVEYAKLKNQILVEIRGKFKKAELVGLSFLKKKK